jgi:hypothetical protein
MTQVDEIANCIRENHGVLFIAREHCWSRSRGLPPTTDNRQQQRNMLIQRLKQNTMFQTKSSTSVTSLVNWPLVVDHQFLTTTPKQKQQMALLFFKNFT